MLPSGANTRDETDSASCNPSESCERPKPRVKHTQTNNQFFGNLATWCDNTKVDCIRRLSMSIGWTGILSKFKQGDLRSMFTIRLKVDAPALKSCSAKNNVRSGVFVRKAPYIQEPINIAASPSTCAE